MSVPKRILLGQLASNGDCLYATTIARQIKMDYPDSHLTWAIGSRWRSILDGNPDVDEVWEVLNYSSPDDLVGWRRFVIEARARQRRGDFDEIYLTQISPDNLHLWAGSVRNSIFRAYPRPISVDVAPILRLSANEVENVKTFAQLHHFERRNQVVLFECAPQSGQSPVNSTFALEIALKIVEKYPENAIVLSSGTPFVSPHPHIHDGSVLTLRENAELTRYCSLLIGASSGISWISTSTGARLLPTIQLVVPDLERSNSLFYEFNKRGADTSHIIEMSEFNVEGVFLCANEIWEKGFATAQMSFHQSTPLKFNLYRDIQHYLIIRGRWKKSLKHTMLHFQEYGFHFEFLTILFFTFFRCLQILPRKLLERFRIFSAKSKEPLP